MIKAASGLSWGFGLLQVVLMWVGGIVFFANTDTSNGSIYGIIIPFVYMLVVLVMLLFRESAVVEGNDKDIISWGIITLLCISTPGGILTLIIPSYRRKRALRISNKNRIETASANQTIKKE